MIDKKNIKIGDYIKFDKSYYGNGYWVVTSVNKTFFDAYYSTNVRKISHTFKYAEYSDEDCFIIHRRMNKPGYLTHEI